MGNWFTHGDMPGFFGVHLLFAFGFFLMWLVIVAGLFVLLYLVIRTAVTRGILRADTLRAAPARQPVASAPLAPADRPVPPAERRAEAAESTDPSI